MTLSEKTRLSIKRMIEKELYKKIAKLRRSEDMHFPFYFKLFSPRLVITASVLQSIFTWFGRKWEHFAEMIAYERFLVVKRNFAVKGEITDSELSVIDTIVKDLDSGERSPDIINEKLEILKAHSKSKTSRKVSRIIDLFLKDSSDKEFYIELKTVKPNKSEAMEAKRKLLEIIAMRQKFVDPDRIFVYLAMPFNPYGEEREYSRWTVLRFFKEGADLLVGKDFWDFIGGANTYNNLLSLFDEIGRELNTLTEDIIENLCKKLEE